VPLSACLSSSGASGVWIINSQTNQVIATAQLGRVGVPCSVINGLTGKIISNITGFVNPNGIVFNPQTGNVHASTREGTFVIDGSTNKVISTIPASGTGPGTGRIAIEIPRALKEEFTLYCKEQHINFDQKIIELLEKKGALGPHYHANLKASSDLIRPKAVKEDQNFDYLSLDYVLIR
jgi:hypothetical protein